MGAVLMPLLTNVSLYCTKCSNINIKRMLRLDCDMKTYIINVKTSLFSRSLCSSAGFKISSDPLPGPLGVLRELAGAAVDDGLDLLLGLLGDGHVTVQVLVNKQSHKHLQIIRK